MKDLQGAGGLVTGASGGIGRAIARALMERGARLALSGRDAAALQETAAQAPDCVLLVADLADPEAAPRLAQDAARALGGLDLLVNCAGRVSYERVGEVGHDSLAHQLDVNFVAPFLLAQRAAMLMRERGRGGAIVNVASTLAFKSAPATAAYAASKAALISMTRSFALELASDDIRVNAVAPGVIDTPMVRVPRPGDDELEASAAIDSRLEDLKRLHLLERLGTPEEVAHSVVYLLQAEFVTGAVLAVDGGLLLGPADRVP